LRVGIIRLNRKKMNERVGADKKFSTSMNLFFRVDENFFPRRRNFFSSYFQLSIPFFCAEIYK